MKGQQLGSHPGVTGGLDASGNLKPTADFRAVYAALLEQWFNVDSNAILPGISAFARPDAPEVRLLAAAAVLARGRRASRVRRRLRARTGPRAGEREGVLLTRSRAARSSQGRRSSSSSTSARTRTTCGWSGSAAAGSGRRRSSIPGAYYDLTRRSSRAATGSGARSRTTASSG